MECLSDLVIAGVVTFCYEMDGLRTDHMDDYILERTAMPDENVRKAQGEMVFEEELPFV